MANDTDTRPKKGSINALGLENDALEGADRVLGWRGSDGRNCTVVRVLTVSSIVTLTLPL